MESFSPSSQTLLHHRARTAVINAAMQARQKAVGHGQSPAKAPPMPMRNPIMAQKIMKDFIYSAA
jgi:hypothetical protein